MGSSGGMTVVGCKPGGHVSACPATSTREIRAQYCLLGTGLREFIRSYRLSQPEYLSPVSKQFLICVSTRGSARDCSMFHRHVPARCPSKEPRWPQTSIPIIRLYYTNTPGHFVVTGLEILNLQFRGNFDDIMHNRGPQGEGTRVG